MLLQDSRGYLAARHGREFKFLAIQQSLNEPLNKDLSKMAKHLQLQLLMLIIPSLCAAAGEALCQQGILHKHLQTLPFRK